MPDLDYSFSGLKTSFLYFIREHAARDAAFLSSHAKDIAASVQHALVASLLEKLERAVHQTAIRRVGIVGGVAANSYLRKQLGRLAKEKKWRIFSPAPAHCTDNAAMVAMCAYLQHGRGSFSLS